MSTLSQFMGGGIKLIQRGTITLSPGGGNASGTATITAVDTAKTIISSLGASADSSGSYAGFLRVALTNSTTVTMYYIGAGIGATMTAGFQVVEYY